MSGKKKLKKKSKKSNKTAENEEKEDGEENATEVAEGETEKPAKKGKKKAKKSSKKKTPPESVKSDKSDKSDGSKSSKKSKKSPKKSRKSSKISETPKTSDRKIPPTEHIKTLKIPAFPEIEYQNLSLPNSKEIDIKSIIESAPDNAQIIIPAGMYTVELELTRPLSLIAQGEVIFLSPGANHTVTINGEGISIKGVTIYQKYSEIHSAVFAETGSVRLSDCSLIAEHAPAVIATGKSLVHIKVSKLTSKKSPPLFSTDETFVSIENSEVRDSSSTGIVMCGSTTVKIAKTLIACHEKSGIICRDKARMLLEGCSVTGCGQSGIEIGSTSSCTQLNGCTVDGCGGSGLSVYGLSTASIQNSTFSNCNGPAIDFRDGCGVLLTGNKFQSCGNPSLIYLQEFSTVDSNKDTFEASSGIGCAILNSSELTLKEPSFDSLNTGIACTDNGTLTITDGKFNNISKTAISGLGEVTISISKTSIVSSGETGVLLNGVKSFTMDSTTIEKSGMSGIDATNCADLTITESTLTNNRNAGLVCTETVANIKGGNATGNGIAAFEFRSCKGTFSETTISENACGIVCVDKGSCSVEHSTLTGNKQSAVLLISKSAGTIKHSVLNDNGVMLSGKSVTKIRDTKMNNCKNGVQLTGKGTKADIEGTTFAKCKCGVLVAEEAIAEIGKNNFNENSLGIEVRLGSSLKSRKDTYSKGTGEASVVVMSKCEASLENSVFTEPGECGIYCESATKLTATGLTVKKGNVAGIVAQQCENLEVNGGSYETNGRAAVIVSGPGTSTISNVTAKEHGDAAVLFGNGSEPKVVDITADGKESASM